MLIAHLPAGFIVTKVFINKYLKHKPVNRKLIWLFGLFSSIAPDLDLIFFYGVNSSVHHHKLFPHIPLFWITFFSALFLINYFYKNATLFSISLVSSINIFIHLILDTYVGYVWWLYPFIDKPYYLFEIPSIYGHWIPNFVFHWSFLAEICIVIIALHYLRKDKTVMQK